MSCKQNCKQYIFILFRKLGVLVNVQLKEGVKAFWKTFCGIWTRPYFRFKYILERQIAAFTAWCTMGSNPFYWNILISIQASIYTRYIPTYFNRRKNWRNCTEKGCCTKCTYNNEENSGKLWQLLEVLFLDLLVIRPSIFSKGAFTNYGFSTYFDHIYPPLRPKCKQAMKVTIPLRQQEFKLKIVKFIYSKKATKFCKIFN